MNLHKRIILPRKLRTGFSNLCEGLLNLLFPPVCLLCSKPIERQDSLFCIPCRDSLKPEFTFLGKEELTFHSHLDGAIFLYHFSSRIQSLIHSMKYRDFRIIAKYFGREFSASFKFDILPEKLDFIIAVPLHKGRLRERGYNQAEIFGRTIAEKLSIPYIPEAIKRKRYTSSQTKLSAKERFDNVKNAFSYSGKSEIEGKAIGICDDVITTGATMNACAETLKTAGASAVYGLVISRPDM